MTLTARTLTRFAGTLVVPGYAVDEFLGRGSTGVVWAATCRETGQRVALKVMEPEDGVAVDVGVVDREEAVGRRVPGAHLVTVRAQVLLDDGRVALAMGLADGGSLRDVVTIRGSLPLGEVVTALTPLATALAELHDAGVVHADVAPGNVLFTRDGRPMLADLSSAWLVDDGWPQRTLGTSGFTAPEVVLGQPPLPQSDVWSLGALAWYARTGGLTPPPWVGDLHWARAMVGARGRELGSEGGTIADVTAAVGPQLGPLLVRMLAEDPDARPCAAEVALALYRAAAPEPVGLVGHHPDPAAAVTTRIRREAAETRSRSQLREAERAQRRRERRDRRRLRARALVVPWRRRTASPSAAGSAAPSSAGPTPTSPSTSAVAPPSSASSSSARSAGSAGSAGSARRSSPSRSWRVRLGAVALVGLVLASGMLGLLRLTGGPLEVSSTPVAESSPASSDLAGADGGGVRAAPAASPPNDADGVSGSVDPSAVSADPSTDAPSVALSAPTGPSAVGDAGSSDDLTREPVGALQHLADLRAAALVAADPVMLVSAEPAGSSAHETDVRTVTRLREQRQRYADLTFTVRSAEVVSASPASVVLRAVVDRSAYQVVGEGGATQQLGADAGSPLRYTLSMTDGRWRLTEVGPP
ncbi:MAG: serine/threonine-protein kinase [Lapillicoccus sp.]